MAGTAEKYLKPEVIRQVSRLDLRAKFIVEGFIAGLHASPFHGFSVEFSEHRKYTAGDNIADIDWNVYAKTDRFYIKKFQAETNLTGYLVMDLSGSMGYTYRQELTKFEYSISLAAALCYLMIHQQDPVGLIAFDRKVSQSLAPRSKRSQLGNILSLLARLRPEGTTEIEASLHQFAGMLKHRSLVMLFSDLLGDPDSILRAIHRLRFAGHDLIIFHILDEAEAKFPFEGMVRLEDNETREIIEVDADAIKADYLEEVEQFRAKYRTDCVRSRIDYVPLHTGMPFDKALMSYLLSRQALEMSLPQAGLGAGAALAALPVILHLFMRQTPKHVIFPALRLVRERQRRSKKRMRIKNWLLLLARMAILALMALALARPTLYSQIPLGDQSVPTALGLVFDTSLSMKYKDKDKTPLDQRQQPP